jgi:methylenetetrahydrofolate--tRNA-(uracil-5-)-methyltransferase
LLKEELRRGRSLVMEAAEATKVPAGAALAVDRHKFAEYITAKIEAHSAIELVREEVKTIPAEEISIIATGRSPPTI